MDGILKVVFKFKKYVQNIQRTLGQTPYKKDLCAKKERKWPVFDCNVYCLWNFSHTIVFFKLIYLKITENNSK